MSIQEYELERKRIENLFEHTGFYEEDGEYRQSLKEFLATPFRTSRLIGTAIDIDDFLASYSRYWKHDPLDGLLLYCEIMINILIEQDGSTKYERGALAISNQIIHNIQIILEKTGYDIQKTKDDFWEIVKKDALASAVIEDLLDADAAMAVLDYNHFGMKGNVAKKRELLVTIGRYVEPLTDDVDMKGAHSGLVDDVRFCLNNLHIRHNNEEGKFAKDWLEKMAAGELESWYDKAYRSMLLLIEEHKQLETHRQINALKKQGKV